MIKVIHLQQINDTYLNQWRQLYSSFGVTPHQNPTFSMAYSHAKPEENIAVLMIEDGCNCISSFAINKSKNYALCLFQGSPILFDILPAISTLNKAFNYLCELLEVEAIYFPLVYEDLKLAVHLSLIKNIIKWERLPSSVISWSSQGKDLWNIVESRIGSRAERRVRAFEKADLRILSCTGSQAITAISSIESHSWKANCQQDMHSRDNQFLLYSYFIRDETVTTRVAFDKSEPIAYRLDAKLKNIIFCLKWSFNESYRKYSPGFYLLSRDLVNTWKASCVELIDLAGSPDHLKASLETSRRPRCDYGWPKSQIINDIKAERISHDSLTDINFKSGNSIRNLYRK